MIKSIDITQEKLAEIKLLDEQIVGLKKTRDETIRDINKPLYEAKAKAEAVINEAMAKVKAMLEDATSAKNTAYEYSLKVKQAADQVLLQATQQKTRADELAKQLECDQIDFDAQKIAYENDLRQRNNAVQAQGVKNIKEWDQINDLSTNMGIKKAELDRREAKVFSDEKRLATFESALGVRKSELDNQQNEILKLKKELENLREKHKLDLKEIDSQWAKLSTDLARNENLMAEMIKQKAIMTKQLADLDERNKTISAAQLKLDDELKTLEERKKMVVLLNRQNDEKIKTLRELREQGS